METLAELARTSKATLGNNVLLATRHLVADLTSDESISAAIRWWEDLTAAGGEGMVVKPLEWIHRAARAAIRIAAVLAALALIVTCEQIRFNAAFSHRVAAARLKFQISNPPLLPSVFDSTPAIASPN